MNGFHNRGALIVLEGCDRAGKTTQCLKLVESLKTKGHQVEYMNFPDRTTECGKLINNYLTRKTDFSDEGIHLLFSLNRWEAKNKMENLISKGTTLIVDRYSFSGVAFSVAKGLPVEWCKAPEARLLKPDLVIYCTLNAQAMTRRGGFGDERYEEQGMQERVKKMFEQLKDESYWETIDFDKTVEELNKELTEIAEKRIAESKHKKLQYLW